MHRFNYSYNLENNLPTCLVKTDTRHKEFNTNKFHSGEYFIEKIPNRHKKNVTCKKSFTDSLESFKYMLKYKDELDGVLGNRYNIEKAQSNCRNEERQEFCGGLIEHLFNPTLPSEYTEQSKKLKSSFVKSFSTGFKNKRKRKFSEHDGNFDLSRKWDSRPFEGIKKAPKNAPLLNFNVRLSFNCNVSAEKIRAYGIYVIALINHLEANGYLVNLDLYNENEYCCGSIALFTNIINVKRFDEYSQPIKLLNAFNPNYFRRALFNDIILASDLLGSEVSSGLGKSKYYRENFKIDKNGNIDIYSNAILNNDNFINELQSALRAL